MTSWALPRSGTFPRRFLRGTASWIRPLGFALAAAGSVLIVEASWIYAVDPEGSPFWLEKEPVSRTALWRAAFFVHVVGAVLCLAVALPQFSRRLLRSRPHWHRRLGWVYVLAIVGLLVPGGLYLALFAKGGLAGRFGFLVNGFALLYVTLRGLQDIRRRAVARHAAWMVRSWALAATAITFRVLFIALDAWAIPSAYVLAIWLSMVVNLALAEAFVTLRRKGVSP